MPSSAEDRAGRPLVLGTPYLTLRGLAWGHGGQTPVLALHGWLDNAASFAPIAPHLGGLHLVALDLPGHGHSDHRPPGSRYHFVDYVSDVVAAADSLGWASFTLLGHSLGAAISCFVAAITPERVRRQVLIDGIAPLSGPAAQAPDRLARAVGEQLRLQRKRAPTYDSLEAAVIARSRSGDLSPDSARLLSRRGLVQSGDIWRWRHDPALTATSPLYLTDELVTAFLRRVRAPTLVVAAARGLPALQQRLSQASALIADAQVVRLDGGHHLHMDDPELVAAAVGDFLRNGRRFPSGRATRARQPDG